MKIRCETCRREYVIPEDRLKNLAGSITLPCPNCRAPITVEPPGTAPRGNGPPSGDELRDKVLRSVKDLPPMPQVARKAREVLGNPASSFKDLAKVIETDQAIVTRILKIANSPYYGLSGKISSVQHASVVLGVKTLMEVLSLACTSEILGQKLEGYDLDSGELWKHSLAVASASRLIALRVDPSLEQDAFSAGVLHGAGKIILDPYVLERKDAFQVFVDEGKRTFLSAEQEILGFDHARIASEVCAAWHIPDNIALAVRHHHDPEPFGQDRLCWVVHMADAIALMSGIGAGIDGLLYTMHPGAASFLGLGRDDMTEIMAAMADYVDKTTQGL